MEIDTIKSELAQLLRFEPAWPHWLAAVMLLVFVFGALLCPRHAQASNGQCQWEGGPGAPTNMSCKPQDCAGLDGLALCSMIEVRPPTGISDEQADGNKWYYLFSTGNDYDVASFCVGEGGQWNGFYGSPQCANVGNPLAAVSEGEARGKIFAGLAVKFANTYNPQNPDAGCSVTFVSDSGWGVQGLPEIWPGGPVSQNNVLVQDHKILTYSAVPCVDSYSVEVLRTRQVQCPNSMQERTLASGDVECVLPAEKCATANCGRTDPVSLLTGGSVEQQIDYRDDGPGGLQFGHFYNSQSRFHLYQGSSGSFAASFSDYFHFSYDRHLTVLAGNAQLSALLMREDGSVEPFDSSGNELLNRAGAADKLTATGSGWTLALADQSTETYDSGGRLTQITSRTGVVTTLTYDGRGLLQQVADPFGHVLSFTYNPTTYQLAYVTLPDGVSTLSFTYGLSGQLMTVAYPDNSTVSYQYTDPNNSWLLTGITDESGQQYVTYTYNQSGVVASEQQAGGVGTFGISQGGYADNGTFWTNETDPLGQTRTYSMAAPAGVYFASATSAYCEDCPNLWQATFDANGNYQSKTDLNGLETTYVYDLTRNLETSRTEGLAGGQVTTATRTITTQWHPSMRLPLSISTYAGGTATGTPVSTASYTYDGYGNVLTKTVTDGPTGAGRTWTYTYYNSGLYGQVKTVDGPRTDVNDTTSYTYYNCTSGTGCGQVQTITDALGHVTTFNSYDVNGRPLSVTDPNGVVTTLTYDARQRIKTQTVAGELTRYDYYPNGLLHRVTLPDASFVTYLYDAAHRLTEIDDAVGNRIVYTLDAAGNRVQEQHYDPFGTLVRTHSQVYNALGELSQDVTSSQLDSQATHYGYDNDGNRTSIAAPLARTTGSVYDSLGRLQQSVDPAGGVTSFGYDPLDNLVSVTDPRRLVTGYTYNGLGDLTQQSSPDTGVTQRLFDSGGNLHSATDGRGVTASYAYDALNRPTQITYPDQTIAFTYDQGTNGLGRLSSLSDGSGSTSYGYDPLGRVIQKTQRIGSTSLVVAYAYQNGQLQSVTTPSGQALAYTYDADGQLSGVSINGAPLVSSVQYSPFGPVAGWTWGNGTSTTRSYDLDGRLAQISSAGTSTYTFDDAGGISSRSDDWEHDYSVVPGTMNVSLASNSNQIISTSGALVRTYAYDGAGNSTSVGGAAFTYTGSGRMGSAAVTAGSTTYLVNALGQRVSKASSASTELFAYDESGHLIGEYTGGGVLIEETVWLGDTPIATLRPKAGGGVDTYYVHTDQLNTPRRISRPVDGVIVWRWSSDPFGNGFVDEDPDGDGQTFTYNLRFPGQYFDTETGLNYNYFRDYDPATGRYAESDPSGLYGGINTYAYVGGNPISQVDPLGLFTMVFISRSYGIGDHASVYTSRGADDGPAFYDPAGGFKADMSGDLQMLFGKDADIPGYLNYQLHSDDEVDAYYFATTKAEEEQIINNAMNQPYAAPFQCSTRTSSALKGVGRFKSITPTAFPGRLASELSKVPGAYLFKYYPTHP